MATFLLAFFTIILVLLSLFMVLLILMQRPSANAGMGSAMGGSAMESAFGAGATNVLTKITIYCTVAFFVITFGLYLGYLAKNASTGGDQNIIPETGIISSTPAAKGKSLTDLPAEGDSNE